MNYQSNLRKRVVFRYRVVVLCLTDCFINIIKILTIHLHLELENKKKYDQVIFFL